MKRPYKVTVGVDGSVYRFHPFFKRLLDQKISDLIDKEVKVGVCKSVDGKMVKDEQSFQDLPFLDCMHTSFRTLQ